MCGCNLHFCLCSCYIVCSKFILYMQYVQTYTNAFLAIIVVHDLLYVRLVHMMRGSLHRIVLYCFLEMPLYGFELLVSHLMLLNTYRTCMCVIENFFLLWARFRIYSVRLLAMTVLDGLMNSIHIGYRNLRRPNIIAIQQLREMECSVTSIRSFSSLHLIPSSPQFILRRRSHIEVNLKECNHLYKYPETWF